MVIRSSSAREVQQLIADLREGSAVDREAAIARLRVLGSRTVLRLVALVRDDASADVRTAALKALDGIDDSRAVDVALTALRDPDTGVRLQAVLALRGWLAQEGGTRIMDALASVALDAGQDQAVQDAARDALALLPADIVAPILDYAPLAAPPAATTGADDPRASRAWLAANPDAPLSSLHDLIVRIRAHESREARAAVRDEWLAARGAVHARLAQRASLVALYDLREAFDAAKAPLPGDFLAAIATIGDATCLEPLARAWSQAPESEGWWRQLLADTAATIVRRLSLTARHPAVKRVKSRWKTFL